MQMGMQMHTSPPHLVFFFMQRMTLIGRSREVVVGSSTSGRPSTFHLSLSFASSSLLRLYKGKTGLSVCSSQSSSGYYSLPCDFNLLCRFHGLLLLAGHGHSLTVHRKTDATSTLISFPYHLLMNVK
ncbi:hypothetical protein H112_04267 [Trichophyton rubrum D6]|uniref:Uncharacterized protein n=3 Tax=Trichophyton TaxID=5550 RepID=A0A080WMM0_TRIRC|nr:uncharacterized protein TERG_04043 [Trichophyton rubrum CBS 118892]EZF22754.1 hypothetical protein H100_04273 [Trichophyton rubrum MR850]EZF42007.1 hypothetical protein H102_04259 [Trichophyton rubrum CBS 100081]EZF52712.1 hypothetical protein H103_04267 [Trichophyton rubrum CBS 288.86]EZF63213.1 hypothetical protein H104_04257 [Trichophyton rubrum CBS 289.86]EZF73946.1 hypothetical protein H105_04284 [Trichophyton soudanense CBS 452.61]EZF84547.1 hypothetical protein H110_04261 [Trichophy